ncbi:MAG TPA: methylmalonyl-CoA epimerase [Anaerolineae bacterium]|nr:methylmalonyl-CoA epimerase [Anaerolineae bacterium]
MLKKVDHIGIVVRSIEEALRVYRDALGLPLTRVQEVPEQQVRIAFLPVGDCEVELVEPTAADSGVARFLERRGEGLHHICFEVDDIEAALRDLAAKGLRPIDKEPRRGAIGRVAFLHPKSAHGVLIELVEKGR